MRFMVIVKASKESEAGVLPSQEILDKMGKFNLTSNGHKPEVQEGDEEGQAFKTLSGAQMTSFQIETMALKIGKHFFNPHAATVEFDSNP